MQGIFSSDFDLSSDTIWLNCAHQGPLPKKAIESIYEATSWKINPHTLPDQLFFDVPHQLKKEIGKLVNAPLDEIILGNSTSYGLHLLVNGIKWSEGDEILLVEGDFPANIVPWFPLKKEGVKIKFIKPESHHLSIEDVKRNITPKTRLFCSTWVNSFTGYAIDVKEIGKLCQVNDVKFILNGSQAIGCKNIDVSSNAIDGVVCCGSKWLCGPYGTGFTWLESDIIRELEYKHTYWLTMQKNSLNKMRDFLFAEEHSASKYDVFGTANFLNFVPWTASIQYLLEKGIKNIEKHNQRLITELIENLDPQKYRIISPVEENEHRSCIIVLDSQHPDKVYEQLKRERIHVALRENKVRISPHLYNTMEQVHETIRVLNDLL